MSQLFTSIISLIASLTAIILGIYISLQGLKDKVRFSYFLAVMSAGLWLLFYSIWLWQKDEEMAILLLRVVMFFAIFTYPTLLHFVFNFLNYKNNIIIYLAYFSAVILALFDLFTDYFMSGVSHKLDYVFWPNRGGFVFDIYVLMWIIVIFISLFLLFSTYKKTSVSLRKTQLKLVLIGIILGYIGGATNFFLWYDIPIPPIGNILIPIYFSLIAYVVLRYRFMDIRMFFSQILAMLFLFISFSQLFLLDTDNIYIKIIVFILTVVISLFLIYSVNQESQKIKEIEKLNSVLNKANINIADKNKYLEELLNMKTEFLRVVNHQLNTPLSIMRNAFAMVEEKVITPEKGFSIANNGLKRISETISDFWEAYELEGVKMKMKRSETDIEKITYSLIDEKKKLPIVTDRKLKINFEKPKFKIPHVYCDSQKIVHVLSNLLDNAVYYTQKGTISVGFEKDSKFLKVKIKDTGLGISADNKANLFQKFSRGQGAINMRPDGSGLGLFIARKIIEGNNGQIGAESKGLGKGSTFYFTLPIYNKRLKKSI